MFHVRIDNSELPQRQRQTSGYIRYLVSSFFDQTVPDFKQNLPNYGPGNSIWEGFAAQLLRRRVPF